MKKTTFLFFFILSTLSGFSQTPYSNYLDMTSEWRNKGGGWNGISGYSNHTTTYFDGYETINGNVYYKQYAKNLYTSSTFTGTPISELTVSGPVYIREDQEGNFYYFDPTNNPDEYIYFENQQILDAQIGDPFPYPGATCNVESIQTISLGPTSLKKVEGLVVSTQTGTIEGIGFIGLACAMGIEGNSYLSCYTKQGVTLQFGTADCDSFPMAERVNLSTNSLTSHPINIYPNPTNGLFTIELTAAFLNTTYKLYDSKGALLKEGSFKAMEQDIDLSDFSSGIYFLKIISEDASISKKIIKR